MTTAADSKPVLAKLLITAGYPPRAAKALAWLVQHGAGVITSREMEIGANLRQPEAHYAINILTSMGWIKTVPATTEQKRGRPEYRYEYTLTPGQAVSKIKKEMVDKQVAAIAANIEQIQAAIMDGSA